jgi:hypothetical protein
MGEEEILWEKGGMPQVGVEEFYLSVPSYSTSGPSNYYAQSHTLTTYFSSSKGNNSIWPLMIPSR